jgi:hypothetical protein
MTTTWRQDDFRFRNNDGSESAATWITTAHVNITRNISAGNISFRLRIAASEQGSTAGALTAQLFYQKNGSGGYIQVGAATSGIKVVTTSYYADDAATSSQMSLTPFVAGKTDLDDGICAATASIARYSYTEHEYMLQVVAADCVRGDYFDFQEHAGTAAFTTYTYTPRVTITNNLKLQTTVGAFTETGNGAKLTYTAIGTGGGAMGLLLALTYAGVAGVAGASGVSMGLLLTLTYAGAGTPTAYALKTTTGTFTKTGNNAILGHGYKVLSALGVFTETGSNAILLDKHQVRTTTGVFVETGNNAILAQGYKILLSTGAYILVGNNATLIRRLFGMPEIRAETGVFTLTVLSAILLHLYPTPTERIYVISFEDRVMVMYPDPSESTTMAIPAEYRIFEVQR